MHTFFKPAAHTEKPWLRRWEAALMGMLTVFNLLATLAFHGM